MPLSYQHCVFVHFQLTSSLSFYTSVCGYCHIFSPVSIFLPFSFNSHFSLIITYETIEKWSDLLHILLTTFTSQKSDNSDDYDRYDNNYGLEFVLSHISVIWGMGHCDKYDNYDLQFLLSRISISFWMRHCNRYDNFDLEFVLSPNSILFWDGPLWLLGSGKWGNDDHNEYKFLKL